MKNFGQKYPTNKLSQKFVRNLELIWSNIEIFFKFHDISILICINIKNLRRLCKFCRN